VHLLFVFRARISAFAVLLILNLGANFLCLVLQFLHGLADARSSGFVVLLIERLEIFFQFEHKVFEFGVSRHGYG